MKNIHILIVIFSFFSYLSYGQTVSVKEAKKVAKNHYYIYGNIFDEIKYDEIIFSEYFPITDNTDTLFHIFNVIDNKGFVIVSADKRAYPVIGYSTEGSFDINNQAPSFISFIDLHKQDMVSIKTGKIDITDKIKNSWIALREKPVLDKSKGIGVEPLLETTWNQGCGYNALCPEDPDGPCGRAWAGCVATAQAQIMKYWNFPETGNGSHSYEHSQYGTLSANFGENTYNWDNMPNGSPNNDVAKLIYHVGVSVVMNFGPNGSSAYSHNVPFSLTNYFGYSIWAEYFNITNYSEHELINIITKDLNESRPLYYSGCSNTDDCHALVIDGYQVNGSGDNHLFHFNYGWGGTNNGYYRLFSLSGFNNPSTLARSIHPGDCGVFELPFLEDFETNTSYCWTGIDHGIGEWIINENQNFTPQGNNSAHYNCLASIGCHDDVYLISPQIQLPESPDTTIELSFRSLNLCPNLYGNSKNRVLISTDNGNTFTEIWVADSVENIWYKTSIILDEYAGEIINVVFQRDGAGAGTHNWYIDDIKIQYIEHSPPMVSTLSVSADNENSASVLCIVEEAGDSPVIEKGVVWSTTSNPSIENNIGFTNDGQGVGAFQSSVTGLNPEETYYIRAYAKNNLTVAYGNELSFTTIQEEFICGESTVTDIDGNIYNTVTIGSQCWIAENLKTTRYRNGEEISNPDCVVNFALENWAGISYGAYIWIDLSYNNKDIFGALYNWYAVDDDRGLCPEGWKVPSFFDWFPLERYVDIMEEDYLWIFGTQGGWYGYKGAAKLAGNPSLWNDGKLKNEPDFGTSGFNAIPSGFQNYHGIVGLGHTIGKDAYFWSTPATGGGGPYYRRLHYDTTNIEIKPWFKNSGKSVRCVKNIPSFMTKNVVQINENTAEGGVIFTNTTDAEIESLGLVWGTSENPTITDNSGIHNNGTELSNFDYTFTNFSTSEKYYIRAYITYSNGTTYYSNQVLFVLLPPVQNCPGDETVTDIDGNIYNTVLIGEQCWMAENLKVTRHPKGYDITRYCIPWSDTTCTEEYGGLYSWETVMYGEMTSNTIPSGVQGICPDGWHLPSDEEWTKLENYMIERGYNHKFQSEGNKIAKSLASEKGIWKPTGEDEPQLPGTPGVNISWNNNSGFSAYDAWSRDENGSWIYPRRYSNFWSATAANIFDAKYRRIHYNNESLITGAISKQTAFSVRCLKQFTTDISTQNYNEESGFNIYPNPAKNKFTLAWNNHEVVNHAIVEIYDIKGKLILKTFLKDTNTYTFDLSEYPEGVYSIRVIRENKTDTKKIIIIK